MIYTFYSYKGGVGRSMALINIAELMYRSGSKVLMVDWDLEAPGLERYYPKHAERVLKAEGVIDLLIGYKERAAHYRPESNEPLLSRAELDGCLVNLHEDESGPGRLLLLPAGRRVGTQFVDYASRVTTFDWQDFYESWEGEVYFEWLRKQLNEIAESVLVDARTGVTEMGGVCTYQLADKIIMFCAANRQNVDGTLRMLKSFTRPELPKLRQGRELQVVVVPSRIERLAETKTLNRFRQDFAKAFMPYMTDLVRGSASQLVNLEIPYVPYYAFEEIIAVRETSDSERSVEMETAYAQLYRAIVQGRVALSPPTPGESEYRSFEVWIAKSDGKYAVTAESALGEARASLSVDLTEPELTRAMLEQDDALRQAGTETGTHPSDEQATRTLGAKLYSSLFTGDVLTLFDASYAAAAAEGKGLRLKLTIDPPELAVLPWELLFDERNGEFLALSGRTPVVRYLAAPQAITALAVTPPLRILGMIASPTDLEPLDVEREKAGTERAVAGLVQRGLVELTWLVNQTWRDLQRALRGGPWHVFHFVGHGGYDPKRDEGSVVLAGEDGHSQYLPATQLARLLVDQVSLRLVLLNAWEGARSGESDVFSSTSSTLVRRGIPAVLAMQHRISDRAAFDFLANFYEAVADGLPVDLAVTEGRKAMSLAADTALVWGAPVLYSRAPDGLIFNMAHPI